ncbi:MAG: TrkA family potassium uptake protein [Myxococcales bacterium]|nr:TrkA family potassium uptake protein [Polyangiaceae bacterium]MDW8251136.1 TrkA family potassium uptake protein [Myxococcales bacterium]
MRVLIAGAGRAGIAVALHLRDAGHSVTLIDRDPVVARRAADQHGLVAITGDATEAELLREAEVHRTDVVGAMLRRDADNLAVALLAQAAGCKRVMVRMRDASYRPVYRAAGVQRVLSELDVYVGAFGTALEHEAVRNALFVGHGTSVAFEMVVPADSVAVGRSVAEISADQEFPESCVVAGMYSSGSQPQKVRGSSVIEAGMSVLLVVPRGDLQSVISFFMRRR